MRIANAWVTYRGWENGPAWGTYKEMKLELVHGDTTIILKNVREHELDALLAQLNQCRMQLIDAPMKNAGGPGPIESLSVDVIL